MSHPIPCMKSMDLWHIIKKDRRLLLCGEIFLSADSRAGALKFFLPPSAIAAGMTSIWMFPIYGMACIIKPLYRYFKKIPALFRGFIYSTGIFCFEYLSGSLLKKHHLCPWDYSNAPTNINGVIRLDYAPVWMAAGLIFEKILSK